MKIDILTLFPGMFSSFFSQSLLGRAIGNDLLNIQVHDIRSFSDLKHQKVDDKPFGGGPGMVLRVDVLHKALSAVSKDSSPWVIYLSPQGRKLEHSKSVELSKKSHLVLVCGHYEGVDERFLEWVDEEVSIGDYVLTGGEIPAIVLVDAVSRWIPGVVKELESVENDSFCQGLLDHSHYTHPVEFMGMSVPTVLRSGNHQKISDWKKKSALFNTQQKRPELLKEDEKQ